MRDCCILDFHCVGFFGCFISGCFISCCIFSGGGRRPVSCIVCVHMFLGPSAGDSLQRPTLRFECLLMLRRRAFWAGDFY